MLYVIKPTKSGQFVVVGSPCETMDQARDELEKIRVWHGWNDCMIQDEETIMRKNDNVYL